MTPNSRLAGGLRAAALAVAALLLTSACGMRVSKGEIVAAARGTTASEGSAPASAGSVPDVPGAPIGVAVSGPGTPPAGAGGPRAATGGSGQASGADAPQGARSSTTSAGATRGAPLKVASVGTLSGPAGATLLPSVRGLQAWVRAVNDKGGLNGHPVELTVVDDGGDPAKHRSVVQDLVENKGVVAFVNNAEQFTGQGTVAYLESKRIPVIGTDGGAAWANTSPMYFPQGASAAKLVTAAAAGLASQAVAKGMTKAGILSCQEAQVCRDFAADAPAIFERHGLKNVYSGQASIAQPDFTAECLNAKNAGVELLAMPMDTNSVGRIARSCAQQGFRPLFGIIALMVTDAQKGDANLDGHLVANVNVFPWFQSSTPATQEFQAAAKRYGLEPGVGGASGWTSGKVLERAAANLGGVTNEDVLKGLWSIRNDTLGGLTAPLTFDEGQPPKMDACGFAITVSGGQWISPDNFKLTCG